ncbi:hypothetical protein [Hymenobacter ruricola]|uniref:Nucleotidyl transferase AbiEii/AbiGii toxin family protein n=1 Tax=Hymenobacter ruricola TaxID=2791023 RepID=A0ABS0I679_9BACT|nr:hypothetical protein [Hymenobacter ruricola]MBF9222077.1 hypothetical protein [Hymenobacter ruricola]
MATLAEAQRPINDLLVARLRAAGCVRGRFVVSGAAAQFSLSGERADGKSMLFWDFEDRIFNRLVADYLEAGYPPGTAGLAVEVDVPTSRCTYQLTTETQQAALVSAEQDRELRAKRNRRRSRTPYGPELAGQVADVLLRGARLAHAHRDYCGMGLEYRNHEFYYGEVWDGYYVEAPKAALATRDAFVQWLARQSDHSLSRVEETDPWYWDNQTITRARLEEFVR